jgi:hypothetical protein
MARRTRDVAYELYVSSSWRHWHVQLAFDSDSARDETTFALIFAMADKLAVAARADVGTLYPESFAPVENPVGRKYKTKNNAHLHLKYGGLEEFGLTRLGARSFLSARVTELIGRDLIDSSGCPSLMLERGILRIDLTERPYSLNRSELEQAMVRTGEALEPSKVLPTTMQVGKPPHARIVPLEPGARWVALPGVRAKKERVAASSYGSPAEEPALQRGPLRVHLVTARTFSESWLHEVCEVIEQLGPEQFLMGGRPAKYDRSALVSCVKKALDDDEARTLTLRNKHRRPFNLNLGFLFGFQTHLLLELPDQSSRGENDCFDLLLVADQLAQTLDVDLGTLGPPHPGTTVESRSELLGEAFVESLAYHGLSSVGIRTWLGARVRSLVDVGPLEQLGICEERLGGGVTRLDLDRDLLTLKAPTLDARRAALEAALRSQQLLAEREPDGSLRPGARWVPLPGVSEFVRRGIALNHQG